MACHGCALTSHCFRIVFVRRRLFLAKDHSLVVRLRAGTPLLSRHAPSRVAECDLFLEMLVNRLEVVT